MNGDFERARSKAATGSPVDRHPTARNEGSQALPLLGCQLLPPLPLQAGVLLSCLLKKVLMALESLNPALQDLLLANWSCVSLVHVFKRQKLA